MVSLLETHRRLYNTALAERKCAYETEQRTLTYGEQSAQLRTERKVNPHLALCNFSSCQRTLKRLDRAYQAFFRRIKAGEEAGFPRFRGFGRFDSVEFTMGDGAKLTNEGKAYFQNVGEVKLKLHRRVPSGCEGVIKTATFRRCADGWYVVFVCEVEITTLETSSNPAVGIDLGLKSFLVTSDTESVDTPKLYRKAQAKLRRLQRSIARKKKGGKNRRKAVNRLARVHQHVANQRKDFHHKVAKSLIDRYGLIAHEDLNIKGIVRSLGRPSGIAKSTHDASWAGFLAILSQKAACAAVKVVAVNPCNTTQACSLCGCLPAVSIGLSVRLYTCAHCGHSLDRDVNAAINILNKARTEPLDANVSGCAKRCPRSPRL